MYRLPCPYCGNANVQSRGTTRAKTKQWYCVPCNKRFSEKTDVSSIPRVLYKRYEKKLSNKKRYVITSAQNATDVHNPFYETLLHVYCKHNNAELVVIPLRYKNPTAWTKVDENGKPDFDWWDVNLIPHLCDTRHELNENLLILADIPIQPTASVPLSGFESISGDKSCIIGHPKIHLKTVPVPHGITPKIVTTTGSITKLNYIPSKAGKKGEFHHVIGAVVVELDGRKFHLRHITAMDDGSFIDLDKEYTPHGVRNAPPAEGLVLGDFHAIHVDDKVIKGTFEDKNSIVNRLNPKVLVWHDTLDFYSRNHHHRNDPFVGLAKLKSDINVFDVVEEEVKLTFDYVNKYGKNRLNIFPASNHPEAFSRWIKETDWKKDLTNATFYLKTALFMAENTKMGDNGAIVPDPFSFWGKQLLNEPENSIFLSRFDTYQILNIEVSFHGDKGPGGARGSITNLSRIGVKTVMGHNHGPGIFEGAHQVGTSSKLILEYNGGPSRWLNTHCVIYANGKRSLITLIDGEYTTSFKD